MNDKAGIAYFEVPAELRTMTEKSIEQARVAFNTLMSAAQQAVSRLEGQTKAVQANAKDVSEKAMSYAERTSLIPSLLPTTSCTPRTLSR